MGNKGDDSSPLLVYMTIFVLMFPSFLSITHLLIFLSRELMGFKGIKELSFDPIWINREELFIEISWVSVYIITLLFKYFSYHRRLLPTR
jgi:hypothetical protein